jgi:glycine cleavage system H protein
MNVPATLRYAESHEWARTDTDGLITVGISDHAQEALGDIVFVELPTVGRSVKAREAVGVVESVKAASDIYAPVAGEIAAVNQDAAASPEKINADAYGNWLFKLKPVDASAVSTLMDADAYTRMVGEP